MNAHPPALSTRTWRAEAVGTWEGHLEPSRSLHTKGDGYFFEVFASRQAPMVTEVHLARILNKHKDTG